MKTYEKILIFIDVIITVFYSSLYILGSENIGDGISKLFGSLLFLFLIPYFIAYILSKFSKLENKKLAIWKIFIKIYPILIILIILGNLPK